MVSELLHGFVRASGLFLHGLRGRLMLAFYYFFFYFLWSL